MRKKLAFISLLLSSLVSCSSNDNLTILCPTGAPSIAFYDHLNDDNFITNSSPANIVSSMTNSGSDIVIIDTIKGVDAIKNNAPYKLACNLTFGNFYLASTGHDDNNQLDNDDVIINFGMGQTPQKVFELIYGTSFNNISYVGNVSMAAKCLQSKKTLDGKDDVDYVFIAQPVLTQALNNNKDAFIYANIQEEYKKITNKEMIQAGLFVKNNASKKAINNFLKDLDTKINSLLNDATILNDIADVEAFINKYSINPTIAYQCINNGNSLGLGFSYAKDNFDNISSFLSIFNITLKDEYIYEI
ncbi:MAG: hypothetical protein MR270_03060 [Erysipelotrichaceae bacterium]|nr:hypothetical protein [Erysipelotrichaceae bacterium]